MIFYFYPHVSKRVLYLPRYTYTCRRKSRQGPWKIHKDLDAAYQWPGVCTQLVQERKKLAGRERSWFTAFLQHKKGELNYGGKILKVKAIKLDRKDAMHKKINKAYIEKYTQPGHIMYATGFSDPGYTDYTMEFIL